MKFDTYIKCTSCNKNYLIGTVGRGNENNASFVRDIILKALKHKEIFTSCPKCHESINITETIYFEKIIHGNKKL